MGRFPIMHLFQKHKIRWNFVFPARDPLDIHFNEHRKRDYLNMMTFGAKFLLSFFFVMITEDRRKKEYNGGSLWSGLGVA